MTKQKFAKLIIEIFIDWAEAQKRLDGEPITVRDFDCWLSGHISGRSLNSNELVFLAQNLQEITNIIVKNKYVKSLGIIGTKLQAFTIKEL